MKLIFWGGIVFVLWSFVMISTSFSDYQIEKNGSLVKMEIDELPVSCLGTRMKWHATFSYKGNKYIKRIPSGYCDNHHVGELVDMRYMEGAATILFPNESENREMISSVILGLFGIFMTIYSVLKSTMKSAKIKI